MSTIPSSNPGGNNQTSPGGMPAPIAAGHVPGMPAVGSGPQPVNPFMPVSGAPGSSPVASPAGTVPGAGTSSGSLYNPASSQSSGQSDISKQLIDMYGKGTGGFLDNLLKNMSGSDSAIFQQFLASMKPVEASERAGLSSTLGTMGVGPNSSVNAIAQGNLTSQFNAEAAKEDSSLMTQQLQDTIGIITGTEGDAAKETASSGWDVFGKVVEGLGTVAGEVTGAAGAAGGFSSLFS